PPLGFQGESRPMTRSVKRGRMLRRRTATTSVATIASAVPRDACVLADDLDEPMPVIGFHSRRAQALRQPVDLWADLLVLLLIAGAVGGAVTLARQAAKPYHEQVEIDLSLWSLPKYTLLSLGRGFAAYVLSLAFTLVYGTIAAHHRRAERVMMPALDVLQA